MHAPYIHPSAWKAEDFSDQDELSEHLDAGQIHALDAALETIRRRGVLVEDITREDFPLPQMADAIRVWHDEIQEGRGLLLLRGFPIQRYTKEECALVFWGVASHFGVPQSQSLMGDRLGHVMDVAGNDPRERAYRNSTELALHTDASDIVAMMSLVKARRGGLSGYASGPAVYNELLSQRPDLVPVLCSGFRYHLFGEHAPGESPVTAHRIPVFSERDGYLSVSYLRSYIELAFLELGIEKTPAEAEALDLFDQIAHDPRFCLRFMMEPGDMMFFNNYIVLHNRTEFHDHDDPGRKRHLLRLWLKTHQPRPVHEVINAFGQRDGIAKREGGSTRFEGRIQYRENVPKR